MPSNRLPNRVKWVVAPLGLVVSVPEALVVALAAAAPRRHCPYSLVVVLEHPAALEQEIQVP